MTHDYKKDVLSIELWDSLEHIKYFISFYKRAFNNIEEKYNLNGRTALETSKEIINAIVNGKKDVLTNEPKT